MARRVLLGLMFAGLLWTAGLAAFISALPEASSGMPDKADGVVVYTGGGGARIVTAMSIFAAGGGQRLLISGVHPDTSRERLSDLWDGAPELFECCVDLGHEARSTKGNALEAVKWARANNYTGVLLVTSDYHMPRSILETKKEFGDIAVTPYVVSSGYLDSKGRPQSRQAWGKLAGEYTKYLLAHVKALFSFINF